MPPGKIVYEQAERRFGIGKEVQRGWAPVHVLSPRHQIYRLA